LAQGFLAPEILFPFCLSSCLNIMGCSGGKASPPQASPQPDQQPQASTTEKTLLAATGTASNINPSTEPQKDAVTKTSGEDPGPDTQKTVAAVEETVQEQSNEPQKDTVTKTNGEDPGPDAEKTVAAAEQIVQEPSNELQKDAVTKTNGEDPGPDAQKTVAAVEETVQEPSNELQKDAVAKSNGEDPGPDAQETVAAVEETVQEPAGPTTVQLANQDDTSVQAASGLGSEGKNGASRRDKTCGSCCC